MSVNSIENELVILTKQTLDIFLECENPADVISLYTFYYYTAKWQKTNQPKCTVSYVSQGLKWSEAKTRKIKKQLIDLGLIEDLAVKGKDGKISGHYVKLNYIIKQSTLKQIHTHENAQDGEINTVAENETNALSDNNSNALNALNINALNSDSESGDKSPTTKRKKKSFVPPTLEEIQAYVKERNSDVDAKKFFDFYSAGEWKDSKGNPVKNWKQKLITWEGRNNDNKSNYQKKDERQYYQPEPMTEEDEEWWQDCWR